MNDYPALHKAFQLIALDNNGINRYRSVEMQKGEAIHFLAKEKEVGKFDLDAIEAWLLTRTNEQLDNICAGVEPDMQNALYTSPVGTHELLNHYFNTIC